MRIRQAFFWPWLMTAAALAAEPAARVGYVEGDVFIQRAQGGRPERAEVGAALFDGDVLVTKNGRAQMAVPAAGTVRLGRNSTLKPHSGTSDGPRGGITPLVGREHRNVFEVRIPVLIAGTSEAATLRTTALSDSSNPAFGSPVSDEDINRQMALRKVSPVWPTPAPPSAAAPPVSDPPTVDKPLNASCFPRIPEELPAGWWHAKTDRIDGIPKPHADGKRMWKQAIQISRDQGFVYKGNRGSMDGVYVDPRGVHVRRFSSTRVAIQIEAPKHDPGSQQHLQRRVDEHAARSGGRYFAPDKRSAIYSSTESSGSSPSGKSRYIQLVCVHRGCWIWLQLITQPGTNSEAGEDMAEYFARCVRSRLDAHFGEGK